MTTVPASTECRVWNVMAHAQKPDFVFRRNGRVHLNRRVGGPSVQSTAGSRGVRISGSNAGYTMLRGSVKGTGYPLHSPVSPSLPLLCVTVCHYISTGLYRSFHFLSVCCGVGCVCISVPLWPLVDRMSIRWILAGRLCLETDRGKLSKCHWAHHKLTWAALESNPVLCGEKTGFLLLLSIHLRIYPSLFLHPSLLPVTAYFDHTLYSHLNQKIWGLWTP